MAKSKRSKAAPGDVARDEDALVVQSDVTPPAQPAPAAAILAETPLPREADPLPLPAREIRSPVQALVPIARAPQLPARLHLDVPQALAPMGGRRPRSLADRIFSVCATPLVLVLGMLSLPGQWLGNRSSSRRH